MNIKRTLEKVGVLLLVTFVMFSCEPEVDKFTAFGSEQLDVNELIEELIEEPQTYTILNDMEEKIVTEGGAIVTFPADIFQMIGGMGTSGEIEIRVLELYEGGEIFLNNVPTVSDGRLLESDAVLNIKAFQNGVELELIPGKQIQIMVPNDSPQERMELFYGDESDPDRFNWIQADGDRLDMNNWDNVNISEWEAQDSLGQGLGFGYECFSDNLDWINIDIFKETPPDQKTSVCVELSERYGNVNTIVGMIFKDINSVVFFQGNLDTMQFCEPYGLSPLGFDVTLVVISTQAEGLYHFASEDVTITENMVVTMLPEETSKEEIKIVMDGL